MHSGGKSVKELAEMFGVSQRTVQRIVKKSRDDNQIKGFGGANE
jgi:DNA-binding Lrp family transcriptional regulator